MRILLTGASGFVGQATLAALVKLGADVVAVSRTRPIVAGHYDWRKCDLLNSSATAALLHDCTPTTILHLAWTVEHGAFWTAPENLDWIAASLALARAAADCGMRRFIGTGTCYEYAWPEHAPCNESVTPIVPSLLYGISKDATRRVLEAFCATRGMDFAWARLFFLYGPGEHKARLVPSVASALAAGQPARCSSGQGIRDFIDVRDAGAALATLAVSPITGAVNIGSGEAVSIAEVALMLGRLAGRPDLIRMGALPNRPAEPRRIVADTTRLRDEVRFLPQRTLVEGLTDALVQWS